MDLWKDSLGMESRSTRTVQCLAFRVIPGGRNLNVSPLSVSLVCPSHRLHPFINVTKTFVAGRKWRGGPPGTGLGLHETMPDLTKAGDSRTPNKPNTHPTVHRHPSDGQKYFNRCQCHWKSLE
ncbi:hypothetical protein FOYG_07320 [Fusarium oxysporum NRRL 32931]|uniref:Uncharacterized protein n=1 Tax=Fusarium oxysporum NRRL 32931 TaxID=660029 RepID=W9IPK4_FUSOX|nr:hypothetical protein FOYG_07320 [Fusarium oxysporum NRRL 32931]KAJ0149520.1 Copper amine oxidase 1 [Fusarium oxysporum f. sp. albedinis]